MRFEENDNHSQDGAADGLAFESARARRLGLAADPDFISIIRQFQKEQA